MENNDIKKQCRFCGEEILFVAKKCKHCGEWLEVNIDIETPDSTLLDKTEEKDKFHRIPISLIGMGIGWVLFHFGSWNLILGKKINILLQPLYSDIPKQERYFIDGDGFGFIVENAYFGIIRNERFFDIIVIQWIMLIISLIAFSMSITVLIFGVRD